MTTQYSAEPQAWPPPIPPARSRRPAVVLFVVVICVGAALVAGLVSWRASQPSRFRLDGRPVDAPAAALSAAEASVFRLTQAQPVNRGRDDRCYFAVADGGSDISQGIYCGPLALADSPAGSNFLHFEVSGSRHGSDEQITVSADPDRDGTQPLPVGYSLMRPGSSTRHRSFETVSAPIPTAAAPDVLLTSTSVGPGRSRLVGSVQRVLIGRAGEAELEELKTVGYYGAGANARSAAAGEQLLAFKLTFFGLSSSPSDLRLGVTTDGGASRLLPMSTNETDWFVVSVPVQAAQVTLTLPDADGDQTLSLLSGDLGSSNRPLRSNLSQTLDRDLVMPTTFTVPGQAPAPTTVRLHLDSARLAYSVSMNNGTHVRPSNASKLFLDIQLTYTDDSRPGKSYDALESPLQELRLADGTIVQAHNVSTDNGLFLAYTVPADFTTGTLVLGAAALRFDDGGTETFGRRIEIPLDIPLS